MVSPIKLAVLRTKAYAKIFNYQLTLPQLHHYLITPQPLFITAEKIPPCPFKLKQLSIFRFNPWVKLVALTGARAMNNAFLADDIDLMIITAENRLWLTRLLLSILLFPWLRRGQKINGRLCLNLWLDESALTITPRNLFTAHEICQARPLYNCDQTYEKFIKANLWVKTFLANWTPDLQGPTLKESLEEAKFSKDTPLRSEGVSLLDKLNHLAFRFQYFYMKSKITNEKVGRHFAFFHPRNTGGEVLKKYRQLTRTILVTGCFDLLHNEHKKLLQKAKKLSGILLVGVETDTRVRRFKGPGRPVNHLSLRLKNLRRLGIADQVFALPKQFNDLNHFTALINQIKPDILAVSSSTPHLTVKRKILKRFGGRVVIVLPHNPKISTTKLLKSSL